MGVGIKRTKNFQIFLAGWSARQRFDDIRRDIVSDPNVDDLNRAFRDWEATRSKQHRGFAVMSQEKRTEIARLGGKAVQAKGTAHQWNTITARSAARKLK